MQYSQFLEKLVKGSNPVKHYNIDNILILKPDFYIDFVESLNDCYSFSISYYNNTPPLTVDNKTYNLPKRYMLATNPDQLIECHPINRIRQISCSKLEKEYTSYFIDKKFFDSITYEICGRNNIFFNNVAIMTSERLNTLLDLFIKEFDYNQIGSQLALNSISNQIAIETMRCVPNNLISKCADKDYSCRNEINKVLEYMHDNSKENISLNELCKIAHLSPYYFIKIFKSYTGKTPYEYYLDIKLEKAKALLKQRSLTVTEIAYMLGFSSQSYFSAQFKKRAGCTPIEYQIHI